MKIYSFNVNGIRAWERKGMYDWFIKTKPDFLCIQETKARPEQLSEKLREPKGYHAFFNSSKTRKGYSGVSIYSKKEPEKIIYDLGKSELDQEGRQITLIFKDFVLINGYFPNGGGGKERLDYKFEYYKEFLKFVKKLEKKYKNVIFVGDINIAHNEIDLARPKQNQKEVGFLPEERALLDNFEKEGFIDTFRFMHPKTVKYSWWDYKTKARDRNVGWRIDYQWVSKSLKNKIKTAKIQNDVFGSDHCPTSLNLDL